MLALIIVFLAACLLFYLLFAGADYGAGILELFGRGKFREAQKEAVNHAMGPVWEANHIWLIILVVILFIAFPKAFEPIVLCLHIPLVALLVGIVVRGAVFTFRHYDVDESARLQRIYTRLFGLSSVWASLWLGVLGASLFHGDMDPHAGSFYGAYVAGWCTPFAFCTGVLVCMLFTFLAGIYLIGETHDPALQRHFAARAWASNLAMASGGCALFVASYIGGDGFLHHFRRSPVSLACVACATLLFVVLWRMDPIKRPQWGKACAAGQLLAVLAGWYTLHAPNILVLAQGPMSFSAAAAPEPSLRQLLLALGVGSLFIFPSLLFLLRIFKGQAHRLPKRPTVQTRLE